MLSVPFSLIQELIIDHAMPLIGGDHTTQHRQCNRTNFLWHAKREGGHPLNALDLPMSDGNHPPSKLASHLVAWHETQGLPGCPYGVPLPTRDLLWGLASTAGTYSGWHIDSNGFATFIEVKAGMKWWIIATPKEGGDTFDSPNLFLDDFEPYDPNSDRWDIEAILLKPGMILSVFCNEFSFYLNVTNLHSFMHPNTPHAVLTPENTVCHGGHFYATSTIHDTCLGIYHGFVMHSKISNTWHDDAWRILHRMVIYYNQEMKDRSPGKLHLVIISP